MQLPPSHSPTRADEYASAALRRIESDVAIEFGPDMFVVRCARNWLVFAAYTVPTVLGIASFANAGIAVWAIAGAIAAVVATIWWMSAPIETTIDIQRSMASRTVRLGLGLDVHQRWALAGWEWVEVRDRAIQYVVFSWPHRAVGSFSGRRRRLSGRLSKRQANEVASALRKARGAWLDSRRGTSER